MVRKIIGLTVAVLLLLSLVACNGNSLAEYKTEAKKTIQNFADYMVQRYTEPLGQLIYTEENIAIIYGIAEAGKKAVDSAKAECAIDKAVDLAHDRILDVPLNKAGLGRFDGLDTQTELQIIQTYLGEGSVWQEYVDYNPIVSYCGSYNGCEVIDKGGGGGWGSMPEKEIIDGVVFVYRIDAVKVWKDGVFYSLQEAYDQKFLRREDLVEIAARHEEQNPGFYQAVG